ncbi:MAG: hypothetical protein K6E58_06355 [Eubacterium sp.]|nr:hypothetical protein [Eubacterium sp.]
MRKKLIASLIIMVMALGCIAPAIVSADTYTKSGYACKEGNNIYFAFASTKKSTPIYRFNVLTGKRTKVYPKSGSNLREFKNLNALGKYIYCAARPANSLTCCYIYRINTKNGKAKKIARGVKPTLIGGKIVYESMKSTKVKDNLSFTYIPSGQDYEIEKDGGKKKPANHVAVNVETSCRGTKIAYGKYSFYISKDGKKIYRNNGSKRKLICKAKKITGFRVLDGYLIVKTTKNGKNYAYCVKNNGSQSTKILRW